MDIRLALMAGIDIPVPELELIIHQPRISEIALIGDTVFFIGIQCLLIDKNSIDQDKTLLENINNFQIFMTVMTEKESQDKKQAVLQLFTLIFPNYKISFTPRSLLFSQEEKIITINEDNFETLQNIIGEIFCVKTGYLNAQGFNPKDEKAKEIAEKLMRARQRVAAQNKEGNGSIFTQYISTIVVGISSMSLKDCLDLTLYQMYDLMQRYSLWLNWDLDIKTRLAGGKPESKIENWMKDIH